MVRTKTDANDRAWSELKKSEPISRSLIFILQRKKDMTTLHAFCHLSSFTALIIVIARFNV